MTALVLPSGIVLERDPIRSVPRCIFWSSHLGSVTLSASRIEGMQIVHSLEIECDGRIAIACGADWAEAEHRLYSKVISYAMSVALAEALCARRAAA